MSDSLSSTTVIQLFRKWRSGDESSGQEMAQRFSDWYYAISTIRVPGTIGRPPMEAACQNFAQGIVTVTRPRALVDWAHDLLERELSAAGYGLDASTPTGSDNPNAMTRNRSPTDLLQSVAADVDPELLQVLALAYDPSTSLKDVDRAAEPLGGTPFAMLQARYALKRALKATQDVPFAVAPDDADMDRGPISLYEANRLASGKEVAELEKWLLSDIDLCKDIAEFSAFVHALRGGALSAHAIAPTEDSIGATEPPSAPVNVTLAPATAPDGAIADGPSAVPQQAEDYLEQPTGAAPQPGTQHDAPKAVIKTGALRATMVTVATVIAMVVLIAMVVVFILRG